MTTDLTELFGEPIYEYTADQAIDDGVLVHPYPQRWPWLLITCNVHVACTKGDHGRTYDQCLVPLLMDCIMAAQTAKKTGQTPPIELEGTIAGTVWIMPNERGGMTVMWPEEY